MTRIDPTWKRPIVRITGRLRGGHVDVRITERTSPRGDTFAMCGAVLMSPVGYEALRQSVRVMIRSMTEVAPMEVSDWKAAGGDDVDG